MDRVYLGYRDIVPTHAFSPIVQNKTYRMARFCRVSGYSSILGEVLKRVGNRGRLAERRLSSPLPFSATRYLSAERSIGSRCSGVPLPHHSNPISMPQFGRQGWAQSLRLVRSLEARIRLRLLPWTMPNSHI
jgi:hypothetical protein